MSRITSLPKSAVIDRVANANSMHELLVRIPINASPAMTAICEGVFKLAQKASTIQAAVEELQAYSDKKTLYHTISVHPYRIETTKEFIGAGNLQTFERKLKELATSYARSLLQQTLSLKNQQHAYLVKLYAVAQWGPEVRTVIANLRETGAGRPSLHPLFVPCRISEGRGHNGVTRKRIISRTSHVPTARYRAWGCVGAA